MATELGEKWMSGTAGYDYAVPDFDVNTPHIARIYDYWLGGYFL